MGRLTTSHLTLTEYGSQETQTRFGRSGLDVSRPRARLVRDSALSPYVLCAHAPRMGFNTLAGEEGQRKEEGGRAGL